MGVVVDMQGKVIKPDPPESRGTATVVVHGLGDREHAFLSDLTAMLRASGIRGPIREIRYRAGGDAYHMEAQANRQINSQTRNYDALNLVGHSLGGRIVVNYARENPSRSSRVVGLAPLLYDSPLVRMVPRVVSRLASGLVPLASQLQRGGDYVGDFSAYDLPSDVDFLFICAKRDPLAGSSSRLRHAPSNVRYKQIPGMDHWRLPQREDVMQDVVGFLGR